MQAFARNWLEWLRQPSAARAQAMASCLILQATHAGQAGPVAGCGAYMAFVLESCQD